jgi:hypothetical protein
MRNIKVGDQISAKENVGGLIAGGVYQVANIEEQETDQVLTLNAKDGEVFKVSWDVIKDKVQVELGHP